MACNGLTWPVIELILRTKGWRPTDLGQLWPMAWELQPEIYGLRAMARGWPADTLESGLYSGLGSRGGFKEEGLCGIMRDT